MNTGRFTPWNAQRTGIVDQLVRQDGDEGVALPRYRGSLEEIAGMEGVYSRPASPLWPMLKGVNPADIAAAVLDLLERSAIHGDETAQVQLYQLFLAEWTMPWKMWTHLRDDLQTWPHRDNAAVRDLILDWMAHAPDYMAIDAMLFLSARMELRPDLLLLERLVRNFATGAASNLCQTAEGRQVIIRRCRTAYGSARTGMLGFLESVDDAEDREWLLTEGYDSESEFSPSAWNAAVLGDLAGVLEAERKRAVTEGGPLISDARIAHVMNMLSIMGRHYGGDPNLRNLDDYAQGPQVVDLVFDVLLADKAHHVFGEQLRNILCFLNARADDEDEDEDMDGDEDDGEGWTSKIAAELYAKGRPLADPPYSDPDFAARLFWENPPPTIDDLEAGEIHRLSGVIDELRVWNSPRDVERLIEWASNFLQLTQGADVARARREHLLAIEMKGVCLGGLAGLTHEGLHSVYGQVLLQVLLYVGRLRSAPRSLEPLILAGLSTTFPHLPKAAAQCVPLLVERFYWTSLKEALETARGQSTDDGLTQAIDAALAYVSQ